MMQRPLSFSFHAAVRSALIVSCSFFLLAACVSPRSSVPLASVVSFPVTLRALNSNAKQGLLKGEAASAWFLFDTADNKPIALDGSKVSVEIRARILSVSPLQLSLGLLGGADLKSDGRLVSKPEARNLSIIENAYGEIRIRMLCDDGVRGFAVQMTGKTDSKVELTHASIEYAQTGWQKVSPPADPSYLWAGFTQEGGSLDALSLYDTARPLPSVNLPSGSVLYLNFEDALGSIGTIEQQSRTVFSAHAKSPHIQSFSYRKTGTPYVTSVPAFLFQKNPVEIAVVSGGDVLSGMRVAFEMRVVFETRGANEIRSAKAGPIAVDPVMILEWPQDRWLNKDREVFVWDRFPSVLIFDTASYAVQDRYFKRLAFFAEKQGYRGKLMNDADIAGLHAFNAHDYRAESLASFFEKARAEKFPLNGEELDLRDILLASGIIAHKGNSYTAGTGALLSISRESADYLRYMLLAHESFHGIYFADEGFRAKVKEVYQSLDPQAVQFLETYFSIVDSLGYDTTDGYLMENEFMAYILQQQMKLIKPYFTETLMERFLRYGGDPLLADYVKKTEASEFVRAGEALNDYVFRRWGMAGGRTGLFFVSDAQ